MTSTRRKTTQATAKKTPSSRDAASAGPSKRSKRGAAPKKAVQRATADDASVPSIAVEDGSLPDAREHLPQTETSGPSAERAMVDIVTHPLRTLFLRALCFS